MQKDKKTLCALLTTFLKIGAFTFGGGYAMIPLIQKETVERRGWITGEDILEIVAIAESTPGPIAVNAATFVGYRVSGILGAMLCTLGIVLPSFVIISIIALILEGFASFPAVQYAFFGIRAGVLALIVKSLLSMYKQCPKTVFAYAVAAFALLAVAILKMSVLPVILLCACAGLTFSIFEARKMKK